MTWILTGSEGGVGASSVTPIDLNLSSQTNLIVLSWIKESPVAPWSSPPKVAGVDGISAGQAVSDEGPGAVVESFYWVGDWPPGTVPVTVRFQETHHIGAFSVVGGAEFISGSTYALTTAEATAAGKIGGTVNTTVGDLVILTATEGGASLPPVNGGLDIEYATQDAVSARSRSSYEVASGVTVLAEQNWGSNPLRSAAVATVFRPITENLSLPTIIQYHQHSMRLGL